MKYISFFNARSGKWFARSLSSGKTITTARLMDEVANASTVAPADVAAVLRALSDAMRGHLSDGDKVKLDNIGTFYLMADASGNGVATLMMAAGAGVDIVDAAFNSMSGLTSQPALNSIAAALEAGARGASGPGLRLLAVGDKV